MLVYIKDSLGFKFKSSPPPLNLLEFKWTRNAKHLKDLASFHEIFGDSKVNVSNIRYALDCDKSVTNK